MNYEMTAAFPAHWNGAIPPQPGMSLRDYFAAHAMQAEITGNEGMMGRSDWLDGTAELSYQMADAMLKAREQGK